MYYAGLPSKSRKTVRVPAEQLCEILPQIAKERILMEGEGKRIYEFNVSRGICATVRVQLIPEGEVSSLEFDFIYHKLIFTALAFIVFLIALGLFLSSLMAPLLLAVVLFMILSTGLSFMILWVKEKLNGFLKRIDEILLALESEYSRRKLMEDKARWRSISVDVEKLYRELCEKYIKTWGSTFILEYKIREYMGRLGLTRNEAIMKVSEEEGIL